MPQFMKDTDRIVGGQSAPASIPWQVAMKGGCGGIILDSCTVISAAHCLAMYGAHIGIGHEMRMGSTSKSSGGQVRRVKEIILNEEHPYHAVVAGYDFVIFKLDSPLEFNEDVQAACLPTSDFYPEYDSTVGDRCFTSGWGDHYSGDWNSYDYLSYVRVPMVSNEQCSAMYQTLDYFAGKQMDDSELCAGYPEGGKDACQGDSGGPLVCNLNGKAVATGVVSWGEGCAKPGYPGVYGRITQVLDWVKSNMGCEATSTTTTTTTTTASSGCTRSDWQADNYCDDINNNAECNYDGGDCCGPNVDTTYCDDCQCLDPNFTTTTTTSTTTTSTTSSVCARPDWQADNYCDDINNNAECNYDGGDCCGANVDTTYCQECQCLDPNFTTTAAPSTTTDPSCEDVSTVSQYCAYWASVGYCSHQDYASFMQLNCKSSCGLC